VYIAATADVDAFTNAEYVVKAKLNELLRVVGLELDPLRYLAERARGEKLASR